MCYVLLPEISSPENRTLTIDGSTHHALAVSQFGFAVNDRVCLIVANRRCASPDSTACDRSFGQSYFSAGPQQHNAPHAQFSGSKLAKRPATTGTIWARSTLFQRPATISAAGATTRSTTDVYRAGTAPAQQLCPAQSRSSVSTPAHAAAVRNGFYRRSRAAEKALHPRPQRA